VQPDTETTAMIPWVVGIRLPDAGLTSNQSDLTISFDGVAGHVVSSPVAMSPSTGLFTTPPAVSFSSVGTCGVDTDTTACVFVNVSLSFTLTQQAANGTVCRLYLRGVTVTANANISLLGTHADRFRHASVQVVNGVGVTVSMFVEDGMRIESGVQISVLIPRTAGIQLPEQGVPGLGAITMQVEMPGMSIVDIGCAVAAQGAFTNGTPRLRFSHPKAGESSDLIFNLQPSMGLREFETFVVFLPQFYGPAISNVHTLKGTDGDLFTGLWTMTCPQTSLTLMLKRGKHVSANQALEIIVPSSASIFVPSQGIRTSNQDLTISTQAASGPVTGLLISNFQAVGFFTSSWLNFYPLQTGAVAQIYFEFTAEMELVESDVVQLQLKDFTGGSECF
jgi:hypothetical protein